MMEALLVANDFDCDILIGFVVEGPNDLSEAALANYLQDFVAIANVIMNNLTKIRKVLINVSEFYMWLLRQTQHTTRQLCLRISIVMMMFIHDPSSLCERNFTTTTSRPESKVLQWRHNEAFPVSTISEALRVQNPLPRTDDKSWCQWLTVGMPREMCLLRVTWEMKISEISLDNGGEKKELRIVTCLLVISCHKLSSDSHDGIAFFCEQTKVTRERYLWATPVRVFISCLLGRKLNLAVRLWRPPSSRENVICVVHVSIISLFVLFFAIFMFHGEEWRGVGGSNKVHSRQINVCLLPFLSVAASF